MMGDYIELARGIVAWLRVAPERALTGLAERTGLSPGFWTVALLAMVVAVVSSLGTVAVAYRAANGPAPPLRVSGRNRETG